MPRMAIIEGDITEQQVDAIVNAANPYLLGDGGVDGAIHWAAGRELLEACIELPADELGTRCPTGEARITPGFALPARWVIHTVGPVYGGHPDPQAALASAVRSSLAQAEQVGARTVALPAISCGRYGYPRREAAAISLGVARERPWALDEIRFVLYGHESWEIWKEVDDQNRP